MFIADSTTANKFMHIEIKDHLDKRSAEIKGDLTHLVLRKLFEGRALSPKKDCFLWGIAENKEGGTKVWHFSPTAFLFNRQSIPSNIAKGKTNPRHRVSKLY